MSMGLGDSVRWKQRVRLNKEGSPAGSPAQWAGPALDGECDILRRQLRRNDMSEQQAQQPGQMQIKDDEKELQGLYSNLMMIHHSVEEFTLNFIYIFPNGAQGKLLSSMIVSPGHAKRIWRALGENIGRYEAQFGQIKELQEGPTPNVGFVQ